MSTASAMRTVFIGAPCSPLKLQLVHVPPDHGLLRPPDDHLALRRPQVVRQLAPALGPDGWPTHHILRRERHPPRILHPEPHLITLGVGFLEARVGRSIRPGRQREEADRAGLELDAVQPAWATEVEFLVARVPEPVPERVKADEGPVERREAGVERDAGPAAAAGQVLVEQVGPNLEDDALRAAAGEEVAVREGALAEAWDGSAHGCEESVHGLEGSTGG